MCISFVSLAPISWAYRTLDRKSTRLNSSHGYISYAVFCLKKKKKTNINAVDVDGDCHVGQDGGADAAIQAAYRCFEFFVGAFFFNDTATTEIYTLSLHDALPICIPHS